MVRYGTAYGTVRHRLWYGTAPLIVRFGGRDLRGHVVFEIPTNRPKKLTSFLPGFNFDGKNKKKISYSIKKCKTY
ncbi:hypothetical protein BpHYR1_015246 [Brachionus plicatilis]|uniref:Uncharacterized protein n=1 Tax=Brachionus plicatilis TaxID=10195 RepID=A0A3M7Q5W5_BRAPC|nr:hypothetical protein BpHYR1_015246 [Brachionus plicatilis]